MSQAGKAYVYIDSNGWVGRRKQLIAEYDKSETVLTICKLVCMLSEIIKIEKLACLTEMRNCPDNT